MPLYFIHSPYRANQINLTEMIEIKYILQSEGFWLPASHWSASANQTHFTNGANLFKWGEGDVAGLRCWWAPAASAHTDVPIRRGCGDTCARPLSPRRVTCLYLLSCYVEPFRCFLSRGWFMVRWVMGTVHGVHTKHIYSFSKSRPVFVLCVFQ